MGKGDQKDTFGGMIKLIMDVPALLARSDQIAPAIKAKTYPLAASKLLISFLTFHI